MKVILNLMIAGVLFLTICCSKDSTTAPIEPALTYSISCKVDNAIWQSDNGNGAINDRNGNPNAYLLVGGSKLGGDQSTTQFNFNLKGSNLVVGKSTNVKGGLSDGEYISLRQNDVTYVTNKGADGTNFGVITINTVGANVSGTFNGTLYSDIGTSIIVTEGQFNVPAIRF